MSVKEIQPHEWWIWDSENESIETANERRTQKIKELNLSSMQMDALKQLTSVVWDGYLISKSARYDLMDKGLVVKVQGFQVISQQGLAVLEHLELLRPFESGKRY